MPLGQILGGLIGAAGSLIGGRRSQRSNERMALRQEMLQREFAQHGIRWRVEDAKAAGLHPLSALGAQLPGYSPVMVQDSVGPAMAEAGQNIGRAVAATQTRMERDAAQLSLDLLRSQIEETDARAEVARSEAARMRQQNLATAPVELTDSGSNLEGQLGESLAEEGVHVLGQHINKAPTSFMGSESDDSVGANVNPFWGRFNIGKNIEVVLPGGMSGDAAESLESLSESPLLLWMTYMENKHRYGQKRADWLMERYVGDAWEDMKSRIGEGLQQFNPFEMYRRNFERR